MQQHMQLEMYRLDEYTTEHTTYYTKHKHIETVIELYANTIVVIRALTR